MHFGLNFLQALTAWCIPGNLGKLEKKLFQEFFLYCTCLLCTVLYLLTLYCTVLDYSLLYCTVLHWLTLYCYVLFWLILFCTVLAYSVLCTALYWLTLYSFVQHLYFTLYRSNVLFYNIVYITSIEKIPAENSNISIECRFYLKWPSSFKVTCKIHDDTL